MTENNPETRVEETEGDAARGKALVEDEGAEGHGIRVS